VIKILVWCERVLTVYNRRRTLTDADGVVYYFELCPRASSPRIAVARTATTHFDHGEFFDCESLDVYTTRFCVVIFAIDDIENATIAF